MTAGSDFDRAFEITVGLEGGLADDPNDPGGVTKYGIAQRWHPDIDVRNLTIEQAKAIYAKDYWLPACCGDMPWPLNAAVFDAAVHHDPRTAVCLLQKALGVKTDGVYGRKTAAAVAAQKPDELHASFLAQRALYMIGLRNFDHHGKGWFRRLFLLVQRMVP